MGIPRHTGKYLVERILFAFVVLLAAFILLGSPLFEVREIEVTGNSALPEKKIVELSGITAGINIFKVNLKESEARIRTVPLIKDVSLTREFPSRIVIAVEERKAVALLPVKDGFIQVDREGVCLKESGVAGSLPVVTGTVVPTPAPGQVIRDANWVQPCTCSTSSPGHCVVSFPKYMLMPGVRWCCTPWTGLNAAWVLPWISAKRPGFFCRFWNR